MDGDALMNYGVITTPKRLPFIERLAEIETDIQALITAHKPDLLAIEDLYFVQNITTGLKVSAVRGVIMLAAHKARMHVTEPKPTEIKKAFTGNGKADKHQIMQTAQILFGQNRTLTDDAADAIAVAFYGSNARFLV